MNTQPTITIEDAERIDYYDLGDEHGVLFSRPVDDGTYSLLPGEGWRLQPCPRCKGKQHGPECSIVRGCVCGADSARYDFEACPDCEGRGHTGVAVLYEKCDRCLGTGHGAARIAADSWVSIDCDGTTRQSVRTEYDPCYDPGCVGGMQPVPATHPIYASGNRAIVIEVPVGGDT